MEDTKVPAKAASKGAEVAKWTGTGFALLLVPVAVILVHKFTDQIDPSNPLQFLSGTFGVLASVCAVLGSISAFAAAILTAKENRQKTE